MPPRVLFVTGRLAEPALRRMLAELSPKVGIESEVAVLPISVAALLTAPWVGSHLSRPEGFSKVVLPGFCRGDVDELQLKWNVPVERGPVDLRDLPEHFGQLNHPPPDLTKYDIEIIAEINHAPRLETNALLAIARRYADDGADVIDVGCEPGHAWTGVADCVKRLRDEGHRVSIDSLNSLEIAAAARAGAELVLSVNSSNVAAALDWGIEVVAIPDVPASLLNFDSTIESLASRGVPFRLDPILEPIGFGFAASLGRYLEIRKRYPDASMMMGVGNLTELTDVDSAGINVMLAGFCQEVSIASVLTTEVINWARTSVREWSLARRLVFHAVKQGVLPKKVMSELVVLRDPKLHRHGPAGLAEIAKQVTDRNYRLFAEDGELHVINGKMHLRGTDPFALFEQMCERDTTMDPSHAFYLGYELALASTALTLRKQYVQDCGLRWGYLQESATASKNEKKPLR